MSRESESERDNQRSVADLLAEYGSSGQGGGQGGSSRRRRRRAEDASETAPQAIIDRILSDSGQMRAIRDQEPTPPPVEPPPPPRPSTPQGRGVDQPSYPRYDQPSGRFAAPGYSPRPQVPPPPKTPPPHYPEDPAGVTAEHPPIPTNYPPPPGPPSAATSTGGRMPPPPMAPPRQQPEPTTEQLPRIDAALVPHQSDIGGSLAGAAPAGLDPDDGAPPDAWFGDTGFQERYTDDQDQTSQHQAVELDEDEQAEFDREQAELERDEADDAEFDDREPADLEEEPAGSPAREWLLMICQLGGGVLGGAGLWLGFQWLWRSFPQITLFVALAVIVAMVWLVRKIRRADDVQTILLAVLVGLVVTVSPAALLLVAR